MRKTINFKALALGLLLHALISGPAYAQKSATCPAFNAALVDMAGLTSFLQNVESPIVIMDDPKTPQLECEFFTSIGFFEARVRGIEGDASIFGGNTFVDDTQVGSGQAGLTQRELHACRAQIIQSWVWNRHCAPFLP